MFRRLFPFLRPKSPLLPTNRVRLAPLAVRRYHPSSSSPPPAKNEGVSQRLKHLVKSYGWYALGVYLVFSALDFTVAFVGINLLGAEQVSQAATYVKHAVYGIWQTPPEPGREEIETAAAGNSSHEGLYAMIVLAYTIHKTLFLPVRVGLTAALTPRIVGWLRARGWARGQGARRAASEAKDVTRDRD